MRLILRIVILLGLFLLAACSQTKPSSEVLDTIDYIEANVVMPSRNTESASKTHPPLEKSNYVRFYALAKTKEGLEIQGVYIADSNYHTEPYDKFKIEKYEDVYFVKVDALPFRRYGGCTYIKVYYDMKTKTLKGYNQESFSNFEEFIFTGHKEISLVHGFCNEITRYNKDFDKRR